MAPEAGLEPATSRLTAARSTIELLWNPDGRSIYKPLFAASNGFLMRAGNADDKISFAPQWAQLTDGRTDA